MIPTPLTVDKGKTEDGKRKPQVVTSQPRLPNGVATSTPGQSSTGSLSGSGEKGPTDLQIGSGQSTIVQPNGNNDTSGVEPHKPNTPGTTNTNLSMTFSNPAISVKNATFTQAAIKSVC